VLGTVGKAVSTFGNVLVSTTLADSTGLALLEAEVASDAADGVIV
jgi:hypothetical protein